MGAAATRRCELLLGAARLNAGEREDGAGEREERVREDGLPASAPSAAIDGAGLSLGWFGYHPHEKVKDEKADKARVAGGGGTEPTWRAITRGRAASAGRQSPPAAGRGRAGCRGHAAGLTSQ